MIQCRGWGICGAGACSISMQPHWRRIVLLYSWCVKCKKGKNQVCEIPVYVEVCKVKSSKLRGNLRVVDTGTARCWSEWWLVSVPDNPDTDPLRSWRWWISGIRTRKGRSSQHLDTWHVATAALLICAWWHVTRDECRHARMVMRGQGCPGRAWQGGMAGLGGHNGHGHLVTMGRAQEGGHWPLRGGLPGQDQPGEGSCPALVRSNTIHWTQLHSYTATPATLSYTGLHCTEDRGMRGPGHQWRLLLTIHDRDSSNGSQWHSKWRDGNYRKVW